MTAHTPAPWRVDFQNKAICSAADGMVLANYTRSRLAGLSDARIMAAAPELFDELGKAADTFAEFATTFGLFGYPTAAEACRIAERSCRALLTRAVTGDSK